MKKMILTAASAALISSGGLAMETIKLPEVDMNGG